MMFGVFICLCNIFYAQNCTFDGKHSVSILDALECLNSIDSYDTETYKHVIDVVSEHLDSFAYLDQLRSPPSQALEYATDLKKKLSEIEVNDVSSYDFYMSIVDELQESKDPSAIFVPPCAEHFHVVLPFAFNVHDDNGKRTVYADTNTIGNITEEWVGEKHISLVGKVILRLGDSESEAMDAFEYISKWAKDNVPLRNVHARLNLALKHAFHCRQASQYRMKNSNGLYVEYLDGSESSSTTLEYRVFVDKAMNSADEICGKRNEAKEGNKGENSLSNIYSIVEREIGERMYGEKFSNKKGAKSKNEHESAAEDDLISIVETDEVASYYDKADNIGYIRLKSFGKNGDENFVNSVGKTFEELKDKFKAKSVIVDVRSNTGGGHKIAMQTIQFLFPSEYPIFGDVEMRKSQLNGELSKLPENISGISFFDKQGHKKISSEEFYTTSQMHQYTDAKEKETFTSEYTRAMEQIEDTPDLYKKVVEDWKKYPGHQGTAMFRPENILIVTDGLCEGSCCSFVQHIKEFHNGRIIGVGSSSSDEDFEVGTMCGGRMMSSVELDSLRNNEKLKKYVNVSAFPSILPRTSSSLKWMMSAEYAWKQTWDMTEEDHMNGVPFIPTGNEYLAYNVHKVDGNVPLFYSYVNEEGSKTEIARLISSLLPKLDECYSWEVYSAPSECPVPESEGKNSHKIYGHPCRNGVFDSLKCVFSRCEDGYHTEEIKDESGKVVKVCRPTQIREENKSRLSKLIFVIIDVSLVVAFIIFVVVLVMCMMKSANKKKEAESQV